MNVMHRLVRLIRADVHGVVDQMEDKALLLKQCIREMEAAVAYKEAELKSLGEEREQVQRQFEHTVHETEKLEADLVLAVNKERDDIARALIRKLLLLKESIGRLAGQVQDLDTEGEELRTVIQQHHAELAEVKVQSVTYLIHSRRSSRSRQSSAGIDSTAPVASRPTAEEVEIELLRLKEGRHDIMPSQGGTA